MIREAKRLRSALMEKEKQQNLLSGLEKMSTEGTVAAEQYAALKYDYQQKMMAAVSEISQVKQELGAKLRAWMQHLNSAQTELEQARTSYSAGRLSPKDAQRAERKLAARVENSRKEIAHFQALVDAKSSDQLVEAKERGIPLMVWAVVIPSVVVLVVSGLFASWWTGLLPLGPEAPQPNGEPSSPPPSYLAEAAEEAKPSVVLIQATSDNVTGSDNVTASDNLTAIGSGIIIGKDGYILTSRHLVEGAGILQVFLYNAEEDRLERGEDESHIGTVVSDNTTSQLALIEIQPGGEKLPVVPLGDSDSLQIGAEVATVGYVTGDNWTANSPLETLGEVLSKPTLEDGVTYIQTNIPLSPANRGGALVNENGELVGIITRERMQIGEQAVGNISFAIAINHAKPLIPDSARGQ